MTSSLTYQSVLGKEPRPILFDTLEISKLASERILITGAGGSIGSRIVSLLSSIPDLSFLATDRDESALHSLSLNLNNRALFDNDNFLLLDIRNRQSIADLIRYFKPTVLIHAAALKHLSALEKQPREALLTNIFGTADLLEVSSAEGVRNFVNISTDKAANPKSVLGKSKRAAEIYTTTFRTLQNLSYTNCRFGNVFASRGSVIETFANQMVRSEAVTLTKEDMTRFFMHVDEAAFLSIKSLLINAGDVHVFDMGEQVKLLKIIDRMQKLLSTSSPILITGLRKGEKIEEDLFDSSEVAIPTSDKLISTTSIDVSEPKNQELVKSIEERNEDKLLLFLESNT